MIVLNALTWTGDANTLLLSYKYSVMDLRKQFRAILLQIVNDIHVALNCL